MRAALFAGALLWLGCVSGCGPAATGKLPSSSLRIAAASDLKDALPALIAAYRAERAVQIDATYGSSGQLAQQIREGAPVDLFLCANREYLSKLADENVIESQSLATYAIGSLKLVFARDVPPLEGFSNLRGASFKHLAIANPERAPYGIAAKQALESAGIWDELAPRVVYAETVRQALQFVETGNAEYGIVGTAVAGPSGLRTIPIDDGLHNPIEQYLGVVRDSEHRMVANEFARFVLSEAGQEILHQFGFTSPRSQDVKTREGNLGR